MVVLIVTVLRGLALSFCGLLNSGWWLFLGCFGFDGLCDLVLDCLFASLLF